MVIQGITIQVDTFNKEKSNSLGQYNLLFPWWWAWG